MSKEFPIQTQWHEKVKELAPPDAKYSEDREAPARKWLADELRKLASHIENGQYPCVFGCAIPKDGVGTKDLMLDFNVVLSHPWPG